ncbi:serine hydrolase [Candidatus Beckwithbacteria bacterium]|nr:serine hydrolase [Candidatus Beckwithbacteria bacterium]
MQDYNRQHYLSRSAFQNPKPPYIKIGLGIMVLGVLLYVLTNSLSSTEILAPQVYEFSQEKPDSKPSASKNSNTQNEGIIYTSADEVVTAIDGLVQGKQGMYGWYVQSLLTGESYGRNDDFSFTAASINKVPILVSYLHGVEQGKFSLSDIYRLNDNDKEEGTGSIQYEDAGKPYTYEELIMAMGKQSDNTATNAIARKVGRSQIQAFIDSRHMSQTNIVDNKTSPKDMGELFSNIYLDFLFQDKNLKNLFIKALSNTDFEDRISKGVPEETLVVHKIGNQIQVWSDCGLVIAQNPYSICILTDGIKETEAQDLLPKISHVIWNYESKRN